MDLNNILVETKQQLWCLGTGAAYLAALFSVSGGGAGVICVILTENRRTPSLTGVCISKYGVATPPLPHVTQVRGRHRRGRRVLPDLFTEVNYSQEVSPTFRIVLVRMATTKGGVRTTSTQRNADSLSLSAGVNVAVAFSPSGFSSGDLLMVQLVPK